MVSTRPMPHPKGTAEMPPWREHLRILREHQAFYGGTSPRTNAKVRRTEYAEVVGWQFPIATVVVLYDPGRVQLQMIAEVEVAIGDTVRVEFREDGWCAVVAVVAG